jgi:hypothetical protein
MSARHPSRKYPRWTVYRIAGPRGARLGEVEATDENEALMMAFMEFGIDPADRRRIVVRPTS